jgi:hypothetical protein
VLGRCSLYEPDVTKFYGANGAKMPQSVVFAIQR